MKSIKIYSNSKELGTVVPSGHIAYNTFRMSVGVSLTAFYLERKELTLEALIDFHNEASHIQIEALEMEEITLD